MNLTDLISRRRSCRSYTGVPVDESTLETIRRFPLKPLYPDIRFCWELQPRAQVKSMFSWLPPQVISVYSEVKDGYLENTDFLFQQLDLYLQSMGLGVCWLGLGKPDPQPQRSDGMEFTIMLAFGHPEGEFLRSGDAEFKRKALSEISDTADGRLEPARLAPSAVNSQPWYFVHQGDALHACRNQRGLKHKTLAYMNRIDMGIALAHMYVSHPQTFRFFRAENAPVPKGHAYTGSFTL